MNMPLCVEMSLVLYAVWLHSAMNELQCQECVDAVWLTTILTLLR